ncbi:hypothetical protein FN846DRAFT_775469 [Sphaerosporella brunnea]|uniref:ABC-type Fe3+ transport system n=1 Tax=Sphaerosporella brunnea TaxID=1250544 RepID=A0A5J5F2S4_9PEZI|nr:hypothetical protein FN846DRAFT_775469 [Sphaerosporella brunnea]
MRLSTVPAILASVLALASPALSTPSNRATDIERRDLRQIYAAARKESGVLQVAWGGDEQSDSVAAAFESLFPEVKVNVTVDLSKYWDMKTDRAFLETGSDCVDAAFLQTMHDYPRWKSEGRLMPYKFREWEDVDPRLKDEEGYYLGAFFYNFGPIIYNENKLPAGAEIPKTYQDFLKPEWKNKLVLTYPNDDDAIAFLFSIIIEKYGWKWFSALISQNVHWVRGTATPGKILSQPSSQAAISFTTFPTGESNIKLVLPEDNYMCWPQRGAIFSSTKMPESARLFLSWVMGDDYQRNWQRNGLAGTRNGFGAQEMFQKEFVDPLAFEKFMVDRTKVEWYKLQFESQIGTAQGLSPLVDGI